MNATFTQEDLDPGYASVLITRKAGDTASYEAGDSSAVGKSSSQAYRCKYGNGQRSRRPEAIQRTAVEDVDHRHTLRTRV